MIIIKILNKILGAILVLLISVPFIALATIFCVLNFIDPLYKGEIVQTLKSIIISPFTALLPTLLMAYISLQYGWNIGTVNLVLTLPIRISHFFNKRLFFGRLEHEIINDLFVSATNPAGYSNLVTPGLFGKITLKFLSLCLAMEYYLAFDAKMISPHNDISIYFTEKNLNILKLKYYAYENKNSKQITSEINEYLHNYLSIKAAEEKKFNNDDGPGKLQTIKDEVNAVKAAQRCIKYFVENEKAAGDLANQFKLSSLVVLNYVWLAINRECPKHEDKVKLKEKLIWTLFQIQRGYNIVYDGTGADMPECPTGAIGLLVRVICDEQEKMPGSEYVVSDDPSPANLSEALKTSLDRPFVSSYAIISDIIRDKYEENPTYYKNKQKEIIFDLWKKQYAPLIASNKLDEHEMYEIITAGIEAWEPPKQTMTV